MAVKNSTVKYEWDVEIDAFEDVLDHSHAPEGELHAHLRHYGKEILSGTGEKRLVLVRDVWDDRGLVERAWAYVEDGNLPEKALDANNKGRTIPQRLRTEFTREVKKAFPDMVL